MGFFFQAGDSIRVLVRSRGLGDVYKSQRSVGQSIGRSVGGSVGRSVGRSDGRSVGRSVGLSVSYTHSTLPTNRAV